MKTVEVGAIGVGWVGGTRVETLSRTSLVDKLHICDIKPDRLAELKARYRPATATLDYQDIIKNDNISVVFIATTPESAINFATSLTRRIFSTRSSGENPRFEFKPWRMLSPSST